MSTYKFGLVLVKRQWGVVDGGAQGALLLQLPLLLLAHCVGLLAVDDAFGQDGHLGRLQLLGHLRGDGILVGLGICGGKHTLKRESRQATSESCHGATMTEVGGWRLALRFVIEHLHTCL